MVNNNDRFNIAFKKYNQWISSKSKTLSNIDYEIFNYNTINPNNIWSEYDLIPKPNPYILDIYSNLNNYNNIFIKYNKVPLTHIQGTKYSFYHPSIKDIINESIHPTYIPKLWAKDNHFEEYSIEIPKGYKNYFIDYESGVIIFPEQTLHPDILKNIENYPPAITCYCYIGKRGFNDITNINKGLVGHQGFQGFQGFQGKQQDNGILYKENYINTTYNQNEVVNHNDIIYISKNNNNNTLPPSTQWDNITSDNVSTYTIPNNEVFISITYTDNIFPYFENIQYFINYANTKNENLWIVNLAEETFISGNITFNYSIIFNGTKNTKIIDYSIICKSNLNQQENLPYLKFNNINIESSEIECLSSSLIINDCIVNDSDIYTLKNVNTILSIQSDSIVSLNISNSSIFQSLIIYGCDNLIDNSKIINSQILIKKDVIHGGVTYKNTYPTDMIYKNNTLIKSIINLSYTSFNQSNGSILYIDGCIFIGNEMNGNSTSNTTIYGIIHNNMNNNSMITNNLYLINTNFIGSDCSMYFKNNIGIYTIGENSTLNSNFSNLNPNSGTIGFFNQNIRIKPISINIGNILNENLLLL